MLRRFLPLGSKGQPRAKFAKRGERSTRPEMKQPPVSKRANGARRASGAARALERLDQAAEQETT
jgi:hypothetical protein